MAQATTMVPMADLGSILAQLVGSVNGVATAAGGGGEAFLAEARRAVAAVDVPGYVKIMLSQADVIIGSGSDKGEARRSCFRVTHALIVRRLCCHREEGDTPVPSTHAPSHAPPAFTLAIAATLMLLVVVHRRREHLQRAELGHPAP